MPLMNVVGIDVFYRDEGAGPAVVLGHSSTASSGQWRPLCGRLQHRYRMLAPDHVGYGGTGRCRGDLPLVACELAIIDALLDAVGNPRTWSAIPTAAASWRERRSGPPGACAA